MMIATLSRTSPMTAMTEESRTSIMKLRPSREVSSTSAYSSSRLMRFLRLVPLPLPSPSSPSASFFSSAGSDRRADRGLGVVDHHAVLLAPGEQVLQLVHDVLGLLNVEHDGGKQRAVSSSRGDIQ